MPNYFRFGSSNIGDVKFGSEQVDKVYLGNELMFEFVAGVTFDPSSTTQQTGSAPFTSAIINVLTGGTMHVTIYNAYEYVEVYWYKNNVMQGGGYPIYVHDSGDIYPQGRTFSINTGDEIKFYIAGPPQIVAVEIRQEDSSGSMEFYANYRLT